MYKARTNFAYSGRTYLVGDNVPASIAANLSPSLVEESKAALKTNKPYTKNEVKTSHKGEY
jgi:hypothetical protein